MTPLPKEPTGSDPLVQTVRQIIRCLRERRIIVDPSIEVSHTSQGTRIGVRKRPGGGTQAPEPTKQPARWS